MSDDAVLRIIVEDDSQGSGRLHNSRVPPVINPASHSVPPHASQPQLSGGNNGGFGSPFSSMFNNMAHNGITALSSATGAAVGATTGSATLGSIAGTAVGTAASALLAVPGGPILLAAVSGLTTVVTVLKETFSALNGVVNSASSSIVELSPQAAMATAQAEIRNFQMLLKRSSQIGGIAAANIDVNSRMDDAIEEIKTTLVENLGPMIIEIKEAIVAMLEWAGKLAQRLDPDTLKTLGAEIIAMPLAGPFAPLIPLLGTYLSLNTEKTKQDIQERENKKYEEFKKAATASMESWNLLGKNSASNQSRSRFD